MSYLFDYFIEERGGTLVSIRSLNVVTFSDDEDGKVVIYKDEKGKMWEGLIINSEKIPV